jgi:hypothetical protein
MERSEEHHEQCAAMCGKTDCTDTAKFLPICVNGHRMHAECVQKMLEANENPVCPLCRDDTMSLLRDLIVKQPHPALETDDDDDWLADDDDDEFEFTIGNAPAAGNNPSPSVLNFTGTINTLNLYIVPTVPTSLGGEADL